VPDKNIREKRTTVRRVFLDPSSPSSWTVVRVVLVAFFVWYIADFFSNLLFSLKYLFFLIVLSIFFAYLIDPLVRGIRRPFKERNLERMMPRPAAILIAYVLVFTVVGIAIANFAPKVVDQAKEFAVNLPGYAASFQESVKSFNTRFDNVRISEELQTKINENIGSLIGTFSTFISTVIIGGLLLNLVSYSPWLVLVPILSFFFLKDVNFFRLSFLRIFPSGRWRARAEGVLEDVNATLAAYTRAQLLSCLIIGFVCTIGFYILGVKYALLLGIVAGILEFIPLLGPLTLGITATAVASFSGSASQGVSVFIFLVVLRIVHDYITYPRIVRDGVHLPPLAIILSVLAGEQIAGIPGVFLSIPLVAIATVLYKHVLEHSGSKGFFAGWLEAKEVAVEEVTVEEVEPKGN
jgi:predicted PurR-regulated permease PerM